MVGFREEKMLKKNCENCINYIPLYMKRQIRFSYAHCGNCLKRSTKYRAKMGDGACEFYREKDAKKEREEAVDAATVYLKRIAKGISELKDALEQ